MAAGSSRRCSERCRAVPSANRLPWGLNPCRQTACAFRQRRCYTRSIFSGKHVASAHHGAPPVTATSCGPSSRSSCVSRQCIVYSRFHCDRSREMPSTELFIAFLATTAIFAYIPGPAMLYAAAQTIARGRGAGLMASLGIHLGCYVHVIAAAAGLSVLFHAVPMLYMAVKFAGAAWLIWLGISLFRAKAQGRRHPPGDRSQIRPPCLLRKHQRRGSQSQDGDFLHGFPAAIHRCASCVPRLVAVRHSRNHRQPDVLLGGYRVRCSGRCSDHEAAALGWRPAPDAARGRRDACRTWRPPCLPEKLDLADNGLIR